jgi:hypothetical protein
MEVLLRLYGRDRSRLTDLGTLREFLRRARRRTVALVLLDQAVVALGAAMAAGILLLFLGTQILDWYWPALLAAGSLSIGLYRTLRRVPSEYKLAQRVDRRLALSDCLSTGWYFSAETANGRGSLELRQLVAGQAARLCRTIPPEAAVPVRAPRHLPKTAALALIACGMFGVRYSVRGSLDLRPPMMQSMIDFFRPSRQIAEAGKPAGQRPPNLPPPAGVSVDPEQARPIEQGGIEDAAYPPGDPIRADRNSFPAEQGDDEFADEESGGERASAGDGKPADGEGSDRNGQKDRESDKSRQKDGEQSGDNNSLLEKMRDAFQNMLAKLKIDAKTMESAGRGSKDGKQGGSKKQAGEKGEPSQDRASGKGSPRPDQQGDQMAAGGENAQTAQGQSTDRNPERDPAEGEKSGIGKSDGNKDIQDAAQLAAMGKISELFGKRQANLTGEVQVEVSSSRQQGLKTPYSDRGAAHGEAGGEIHRDEIPLIYQHYVQQYFEQVRKPAPAAEASKQ